jgi:hypothetical protein
MVVRAVRSAHNFSHRAELYRLTTGKPNPDSQPGGLIFLTRFDPFFSVPPRDNAALELLTW